MCVSVRETSDEKEKEREREGFFMQRARRSEFRLIPNLKIINFGGAILYLPVLFIE